MSRSDLAGVIALVLGITASLVASARWWRVAQREHYIAGSTTRFAGRWWSPSVARVNTAGLVIALLATEFTVRTDVADLIKVVLVAISTIIVVALPRGLSVRGRTAKLALTTRMRRLIGLSVVIDALFLVAGWFSGYVYVIAGALGLLAPMIVDLSLWLLAPVESRGLGRFVGAAETKLRRIHPRVVAVTGSFGKTTTKNYIATLVGSTFSTVVSPASFNNRGGLSRTVNEGLSEGTEVFVAEMGTFAKGEIAALCRWIPPSISVISALGPVHLERFGSEDKILDAKLEITVPADVVVVCIDYPKLLLAANQLEAEGKRVWRVSERDFNAAVSVRPNDEGEFVVYYEQRRVGSLPAGDVSGGNVACAVAVALELGVPEETIGQRLHELKASPNRLTSVVSGETGIEILDDTYNSNPAGARRALAALERRRLGGKLATVVTPGMVELGARQYVENFKLGESIAEIATNLVVVGSTNRQAIVQGARAGAKAAGSSITIVEVPTRERAVEWVRSHLGTNDVVLYENDLPDHFP
jgi:UDP-N-acetylmuramoyl-tripeptide--D-alanyl-D-alanine ligase